MTMIKSSNVEIFKFSATSQEMRSILINGEPWVIAQDVCSILGITKYRDAIAKLGDDERCPVLVDTLGGSQKMTAINESGLYTLILRSNKPEAKAFRKWVTSEVLPAIRKRGYYGVRSQRSGDYIDLRDQPYGIYPVNGVDIRCIELDGEPWFSVNDIHKMLGSTTEAGQAARKLNAKQTLAKKLLLFGSTQPAWFANTTGMRLLMCSSRVMKFDRQLALNI